MAGSGDVDCEELMQKHRKERKEIQAQIQQLKHSVPKGDKKKKKEVTEQIAKLEADLDQIQEQELADSRISTSSSEAGTKQLDSELLLTEELDQKLQTGESAMEDSDVETHKQKKPSKAQKRRDKKAEKNREREGLIRDQEVENLQGARHLEARKLKQKLAQRGLVTHEVHADGHCLYNAICHQMDKLGIQESNSNLRRRTADYMLAQSDDFLPFLTMDDSGKQYTIEEYQEYCNDVATTAAWGGQLEIRALSHVLRVPVEVLQGDGPDLVIGQEYEGVPVLLVYYRHAYGLGEHYNSVREKRPEEEETEEPAS